MKELSTGSHYPMFSIAAQLHVALRNAQPVLVTTKRLPAFGSVFLHTVYFFPAFDTSSSHLLQTQ